MVVAGTCDVEVVAHAVSASPLVEVALESLAGSLEISPLHGHICSTYNSTNTIDL